VVVSVTLGVLAAGTGISLAATRDGAGGAVTCIVVQDADAAADADSALSDVFAVGTGLHLVSAGRTVDVTVSGPITAAAATTAAATTAPPAAGAQAAGAQAGGRKHRKRHRARPAQNAGQAQAVNAAAQVQRVSVKAADNDGVDPDTVCVKLSKNAFNILGNVANGNNVGAFIATMTPKAANGRNASGQNANGRNANGQNANGQNANGRNADGNNANGQNANGRNTNGQATTNGKNGQNANGKRDRNTRDGRASADNGQAGAKNTQTQSAADGRTTWNRR
jgi:hypothetical protein